MPSGIQNESSKLGYLESGRSIADWMRFTSRAGNVGLVMGRCGRENLVIFFGFYADGIVGDCAGAAFYAVVDAVVAGAA